MYHVVKSKFDGQATTWLTSAMVDDTEIQTLLAGVRTLRSRSQLGVSAHSSSSISTSKSSRSNVSLAKAIEETSRSRLQQLKEQQKLLQLQTEF